MSNEYPDIDIVEFLTRGEVIEFEKAIAKASILDQSHLKDLSVSKKLLLIDLSIDGNDDLLDYKIQELISAKTKSFVIPKIEQLDHSQTQEFEKILMKFQFSQKSLNILDDLTVAEKVGIIEVALKGDDQALMIELERYIPDELDLFLSLSPIQKQKNQSNSPAPKKKDQLKGLGSLFSDGKKAVRKFSLHKILAFPSTPSSNDDFSPHPRDAKSMPKIILKSEEPVDNGQGIYDDLDDTDSRLSVNEAKLFFILADAYSNRSEEIFNSYMNMTGNQKLLLIKSFLESQEKDDLTLQSMKVPFDVNYTGWKVNFMSIFRIPAMKVAFYQHLMTESNIEPFLFLLDVARLENEVNDKNIDIFYYIIDNYIEGGSSKEVNISGSAKARILDKINGQNRKIWSLDELPLVLIDEIRISVEADLKFEAFSRFCASPQGFRVIAMNWQNDQVISKDMRVIVKYKLEKSCKQLISSDEIEHLAQLLSNPKSIANLLSSAINDTEKTIEMRIVIILPGVTRGKRDMTKFVPKILEAPSQRNIHELGFLFGPWLLSFSKNDLCCPKLMDLSQHYYVFDCISDFKENSLKENIGNLSKIISRWNVNRESLSSRSHVSFSHDFVDEMLESVLIGGQSLSTNDLMSSILTKFNEFVPKHLCFHVDRKFQERFSLSATITTFKDHEEVETFYKSLLKIDPDFSQNGPMHWHILKAIDGFFWYRKVFLEREILEMKKSLTKVTEPLRNMIQISNFGDFYQVMNSHKAGLEDLIAKHQKELYSLRCGDSCSFRVGKI